MVIYARVSSAQHPADLDRQVARLEDYCAVRSYRVGRIITEIGSGVNDSRRKFLALLSVPQIDTIVVEHQARATRFGFRSVEVLLKQAGRTIEVANLAEQDREELLRDSPASSIPETFLPKGWEVLGGVSAFPGSHAGGQALAGRRQDF